MSEIKRSIGPVTVAAAGGGGAGYAAADVLVWALAQFGIDASPIAGSLGLLLTVAGGLLGGLLVYPSRGKRVAHATE